MNILLHQCCGPCSVYPLTSIQKNKDIKVTAYFYNPNIHPIQEFYRRMEAAVIVNNNFDIDYILEDEYGLMEFTRANVFHENERCDYCYEIRIKKTAEKARELKFDYFTSTLLYSRMQKHELIKEICEKAARESGVKFYYEDYREGWEEGIHISKYMEIYRQNYCGCIFSEEDRFAKSLAKKFRSKYSMQKISSDVSKK